MNAGDDEHRAHFVIFDCNVYLDVASLLGPPFTWEKFNAAAAQVGGAATRKDHTALQAIALCTSGNFAGEEALRVWTCDHIDTIVERKAREPVDKADGYCGLGWSGQDSQALVTDLIHNLVERSGGDSLGGTMPQGTPPLDHEDGLVWGACQELTQVDLLAKTYCVTSDRGFIEAYKDGSLGKLTYVMPPANFVQLVRAARAPNWLAKMTGR